ncbi:MAG: PIG-L family deacetylase [Sandaracinaceae bacterium]|nr:PIG-L family deacetylase [Sandaracinaceae bacterium]
MNVRKAMILAAHADDETLGAGGLIQKLVKKNWDVSVVVMSDGKISVRDSIQDNRPDTFRACKALGVTHEPTFLGFPDQKFDTIPMADLANAVLSLNLDPDLIVTHVDTDLNLDHRLTLDVAKIAGRPKRKAISMLGMEISTVTMWNGQPFAANYYVDITSEIDTKIDAFSLYTNEVQRYPHPISREGLKLVAQYHGMQCGYGFAEAFHLIRGCENLLP